MELTKDFESVVGSDFSEDLINVGKDFLAQGKNDFELAVLKKAACSCFRWMHVPQHHLAMRRPVTLSVALTSLIAFQIPRLSWMSLLDAFAPVASW